MGWRELSVRREGELQDWWGCECSYEEDFTGESYNILETFR
jgi:hypothetical protein